MEQSKVYLFTGYDPDFRKAILDLAFAHSGYKVGERYEPSSPDIMWLWSKLKLEAMEEGRSFLASTPVLSTSTGRTLILDMAGCSHPIQTHLLILLENPPANSQIILFCPNRMGLLTPIVSRCSRRDFPTPTYGQILVDLSRSMSVDDAAREAKSMERGHQRGMVADSAALAAAEGLIDAALSGDYDLGIRYIQQFTPNAVASLRERLVLKAPSKVPSAYGPYDPQGIALSVFRALLTAKRP